MKEMDNLNMPSFCTRRIRFLFVSLGFQVKAFISDASIFVILKDLVPLYGFYLSYNVFSLSFVLAVDNFMLLLSLIGWACHI